MYWKTNKHDGDPAKGTNPQNGSGYSNPKYDELSDKLAVEFDPAKRAELAIRMQQVILDDNAYVFCSFMKMSMISKASVTGYDYHPTDFYQVTADLDIE